MNNKIKNISSITNPIIKDLYNQLHIKKSNLIIIESWKIINELLIDHKNIDYLLCTQEWFENNRNLLTHEIKNIIVCNKAIIKKLSFVESINDVIVITKININSFKLINNQYYLVLNNIQDPNNMANILRTSVSFGFKNIYISKQSVNLLNEKVVRGSMGSIFKININYYNDIKELINSFNKHQIHTIASCVSDQATTLDKYKITNKNFALILGNESKGLSKEIIDLCKDKVFIKINDMESLNVSSAFAIFAFWLTINR